VIVQEKTTDVAAVNERISTIQIIEKERPIRLSLSVKSASNSAVFFSHNKSANNIFIHDLLAKRTGLKSLAMAVASSSARQPHLSD
jgi:hypothetical protein